MLWKKKATNILSKKEIVDILKTVEDPELGIDIHTLKLIRKIDSKPGKVEITITFTSPLCPFGPQIMREIDEKIREKGVDVNIELSFNPPWEPSEELREMLGV